MNHAIAFGLHVDPGPSHKQLRRRKLRRRLWWSCFIREHVAGMGLGRASRITYYDVPMLSLDDFDFQELPETISLVPVGSPVARNLAKQRELAVLCIEKTKLCIIIRRTILSMCARRQVSRGAHSKTLNNILSDSTQEAILCGRDLETWATMLPKEAAYEALLPETLSLDDRATMLSRATLHMVYFDAVCALHRPSVLAEDPSTSCRQDRQDEALRLTRKAAEGLTRINRDLYKLGLLSYLDATGVANVVAATVAHLIDAKSTKASVKNSALQAVQECVSYMKVLMESYGSAVYAMRFLESQALRKQPDVPDSCRTSTLPRSTSKKVHEQFTHNDAPPSPRRGSSSTVNGAFEDSNSLADEVWFPSYYNDDYWNMAGFGTFDLSLAFQESLTGGENDFLGNSRWILNTPPADSIYSGSQEQSVLGPMSLSEVMN